MDVSFTTSQGLKVAGLLEEVNKDSKEIMLLVHGFGSNKNATTYRLLREELAKENYNSLSIDLYGCGESEGKFEDYTTTLAVEDILAAVSFLKERGNETINLFGSSAGGLAAMAAALKYSDFHKIVLKAPVSDYPAQFAWKLGEKSIAEWKEQGHRMRRDIQEGIKINYSFYEDSLRHVMLDKVHTIKCPVLIMHGDADEAVKLDDSKKLITELPNAKLIILKGENHALNASGSRMPSIKIAVQFLVGKEIKLPEDAYYYKP